MPKAEKYVSGIIYGQPQLNSPVHTPINWGTPLGGWVYDDPKVGDIFVTKRSICRIVREETVRKGEFTHSRYYLVDVNTGEKKETEYLFNSFRKSNILFIRK